MHFGLYYMFFSLYLYRGYKDGINCRKFFQFIKQLFPLSELFPPGMEFF